MYSSTVPSLFLTASKNTVWWGFHLREIVGNGLKKDLLLLKSLLRFGRMNECIRTAAAPSIKWKAEFKMEVWEMVDLQPHVQKLWPLGGKSIRSYYKYLFIGKKAVMGLKYNMECILFCFWDTLLTVVCKDAPVWLVIASNLKTRPSLADSSTAARRQTEMFHPARDSCKRTDQIRFAPADVASLNMKSVRCNGWDVGMPMTSKVTQ